MSQFNRKTVILFVLWICFSFETNQVFGQEAARVAGENFQRENLVAWCIVPFDAKNRGPTERAKMVRELGLKRVAYDWRKKHIPEFETEILEYKKNGLEYFAFWGWEDSMEPLIKKHGIKPQIWEMFRGKLAEGKDDEKIAQVVSQFAPLAKKADSLGLKFGIYNHGGWQGQPKNLIKVCKKLGGEHGLENVGIVYNLHHGHEHIAGFADTFQSLKPYLLCVNLNGMAEPETVNEKTKENKILPIGSGVHEKDLIQAIVDSGYDGPIGVLGHRKEMDAKEAVQLNLDGLSSLIDSIEGEKQSLWDVVPLKPVSQIQLPANVLQGKWEERGLKVDDLNNSDDWPVDSRHMLKDLVKVSPKGLRSTAYYTLSKDGDSLNSVTVRVFVFERSTLCEQYWNTKYQAQGWEEQYEKVDSDGAVVLRSLKTNKTIMAFGNVWLSTHQLQPGKEHIIAAAHVLKQLTSGKKSLPVADK